MAISTVTSEELGEIRIFRRRGLKYMRVRVDHDGTIRLSLPWYVSKRTGINFVKSKSDWISQQQQQRNMNFNTDKLVSGFDVDIRMSDRSKPRTKIEDRKLTLYLPENYNQEQIKSTLERSIKKALRSKTETELIPRINTYAKRNGFDVRSVTIKDLKSRWGSCDQDKNIVLSLYLSKLSDELKDYVLIHELAHTKALNHSKAFWQIVEDIIPEYKSLRRELRSISPGVFNVQ